MSETKKTSLKITLTMIILLGGAYYIHSQAPKTKMVTGGSKDSSIFSTAHADIQDPAAGK